MSETTLPPCPVCGKHPIAIAATRLLPAKIFCTGQDDRGWQSHELLIYGSTDAEADARWRRLAGGKP